MKYYPVLIVLFLLSFTMCESVPEQQTLEVKNNTPSLIYKASEIGWVIEPPQGWRIIDSAELQFTTERGLKVLQQSFDVPIDTSGSIDLITFKKNELNSFQSTLTPWNLKNDGELSKSNRTLKLLTYVGFINYGGIIVDSSATSIVSFAGKEFLTFKFDIYNSKRELKLQQEVFNTIIGEYNLAIIITYDNNFDRYIMENALRHSSFENK